MDITQRFLKYVSFPTQSDETSPTSPSTEKQWALLNFLRDELLGMGISDAAVNADGYLFAHLPATPGSEDVPCVVYIAHVDTAAEAPDGPAAPRIVDYGGGDIELGHGKTLSPSRFPELAAYAGQRIIVTDGATLLGADDKAGVAEIVTAVERIIASGTPHGEIELCFMPDEEIGLGARRCKRSDFRAEFGYTVDGGRVGDLNFENFNAARADVEFIGIPVHPGTAKGKMRNALTLARRFDASLPDERPELTEGYEGFFHQLSLSGHAEGAKATYLIRDFGVDTFARRKEQMLAAAEALNREFGETCVRVTITDSYYNMAQAGEGFGRIRELAEKAYRACGVEPDIAPIRGGTDGAVLTHMGLPCPNLCTGGENFHSEYEYLPVPSLEKCAEMIEYLMTHIA